MLHITGSKYSLKCDQCDYRATTTTHLKTHIMQHLDERPHPCAFCAKKFRTRPQVAEHEAAAHNETEQESCDKCDKKFNSRGKLTKHKLAHHSEQSHTCSQCDKTFSSKSSLRSHERRVHEGGGGGAGGGLCAECGLVDRLCICGKAKAAASTSCPVCGKLARTCTCSCSVPAPALVQYLHLHLRWWRRTWPRTCTTTGSRPFAPTSASSVAPPLPTPQGAPHTALLKQI